MLSLKCGLHDVVYICLIESTPLPEKRIPFYLFVGLRHKSYGAHTARARNAPHYVRRAVAFTLNGLQRTLTVELRRPHSLSCINVWYVRVQSYP